MKKTNNIIQLDDFTEDSYGFYQSIAFALEEAIESQLTDCSLVAQLERAIDYSMFPAGKRIRPMLACLLCADLKGDVVRLLPVSVALEFLHCASLIHDDLPALDDDDMRRGKPACHKQFPEATAVLTGDVLVPLANTLILKSAFTEQQKLSLLSILADSYIELCCGQQLDMLPVGERGELETVHRLKTGSLFKAACQFGAVAAGKEPAVFATVGIQIGTLFQFIDDMLDVFGEHQEKGRSASSDLKNKKETLATKGNREIFERRLLSLKQSIDKTFRDIVERERTPGSLLKVRFLLDELYSRAESI